MRATRSLATAAAAAALLLSAAPSAAAAAAAPPGDEASDAVAAIIASHLQQRTDKERELNSCFNGAYVAMAQGGCRSLDEVSKRRLALHFANCHLEVNGRRSYPCDAGTPLDVCGRALDDSAFAVYSSYTTHVDVLCYTYEHKAWRAEATAVTERLLASANDTAAGLAAQQAHVAAVLDEAARARAASLQLAADVTRVQGDLVTYSQGVQRTIEDTKASYGAVAELLSQLAAYSQAALSLQASLARNVLYVQSAAFYSLAGALVWGLTGGPRTAHTRPWLYLGLLACAVTEVVVLARWSTFARLSADASLASLASALPPLLGRAAFAASPLPAGLAAGGDGAAPPLTAPRGGGVGGVLALLVGVLVRLLSWVGGLGKAAVAPLLLRLAWEPAAVDAWDASDVSWGLRYVFLFATVATILHAALSFTDYGRLSFRLLTKLEDQVDRLVATVGVGGVAGSGGSAGMYGGAPPPAAVLSGSHAATALALSSPGGAGNDGVSPAAARASLTLVRSFEADDAAGDPDWDPTAPDDMGPVGNAWAAAAAAAAGVAGSRSRGGRGGGLEDVILVPRPRLSTGGSGGGSASGGAPTYGAGTGLAAAAAASPSPYRGGGSSAAATDAVTYNGPLLRPRAAGGASRRQPPNPVLAYESPDAFGQLAHMQWLGSVAARVAEFASPADGGDGDDDGAGDDDVEIDGGASSDGGLADDWSDSDGEGSSEGDDVDMRDEGEDDGGPLAAAVVADDVSDAEMTGTGTAPASPLPAPPLSGRKRGRTEKRQSLAAAAGAVEALDGTPAAAKPAGRRTPATASRRRTMAAAAGSSLGAAAAAAAGGGGGGSDGLSSAARPAKQRRTDE